jgi:LmbE family N-acetylglucosaminyl deacetylase
MQEMMETPKRVLIFAAHHDDETIGCGGTVRKWADKGCQVHVCFMTNGDTGVEQSANADNIVETRINESKKAAKILGIQHLYNLGIPCQKVVNKQSIFHKVIQKIREVKPDLVMTHNSICKHRDHKRTSAIVEEACWKASENILEELGEIHTIKDLWSFEITDPHSNPDFVVDITDTYEWKWLAMNEYFSQSGILGGIMEYIDGLSKVRGYSIGAERGESFTRIGKIPVKL